MKMTKKIVCALALAASAASLPAADENTVPQVKTPDTAPPKVTAAQPAAKAKPILLTGSRIPARTRIDGLIAESGSAVVVIDNDMIKRSGAHDVGELLRRQNWGR